MTIINHPSPNFEPRKDGALPSMIIMHYTNMKTGAEALSRLCDEESKVSAHYLIEEDGRVFKLVDEMYRAWHAGKSFWQGKTDINSHSIGIELVNPGHTHGYRPFSMAQIDALISLCHGIQDRHKITFVLGHSDVAPTREDKIDPGHLFPWQQFAEENIGVWPQELEGAIDPLPALKEIGYDPAGSEEQLITAFQRHYVPEVFEAGTGGQPCNLTLKRLSGLHKAIKS